jgi:hypothetical protein
MLMLSGELYVSLGISVKTFRGFFQFGLAILQGIKNPLYGNGPRISKLKDSLPYRQTFGYKNIHKIKKINMIRPLYELHFYPGKSQKATPNSHETIPLS